MTLNTNFIRVWEFDTRPEVRDELAFAHLVRPETRDATLCDAYIDTEFTLVRPVGATIEQCAMCLHLWQMRVREQAVSDVAQELGVTEDEVF